MFRIRDIFLHFFGCSGKDPESDYESGCGSRRPKNKQFRHMRIWNTVKKVDSYRFLSHTTAFYSRCITKIWIFSETKGNENKINKWTSAKTSLFRHQLIRRLPGYAFLHKIKKQICRSQGPPSWQEDLRPSAATLSRRHPAPPPPPQWRDTPCPPAGRGGAPAM